MEREEEEENGRQKVSERMGEKKGPKREYLMGSNPITSCPSSTGKWPLLF